MSSPDLIQQLQFIAEDDSMCCAELLSKLNELAFDLCSEGPATIVEIGAYRGASTAALALAARAAGQGIVHSIDPHKSHKGLLGGRFSEKDHQKYEQRLQNLRITNWVIHYCKRSEDVAKDWEHSIDLLWIDGDHSYDGIASDISLWVRHVRPGGFLFLDDATTGSEVSEAIRDHLPFSLFVPIEKLGRTLILQRVERPRTLYLCGGMQSSGTTLVSMCFLQRDDMDGVYDMDNPFIQQDFSKVFTKRVWVKMTIGSFRLAELVNLYSAQGWDVRPILVIRNEGEILASLKNKWYGLDGCTGDDPPLLVRLLRYRHDIQDCADLGWTKLDYAELIERPEEALRSSCVSMGLEWDPRMSDWSVDPTAFAYPSDGNLSLRESFQDGQGLLHAIKRYKPRTGSDQGNITSSSQSGKMNIVAHSDTADAFRTNVQNAVLPPLRFRGTRRQTIERRLSEHRAYIQRLYRHRVIGPILALWARYVNCDLKPPK